MKRRYFISGLFASAICAPLAPLLAKPMAQSANLGDVLEYIRLNPQMVAVIAQDSQALYVALRKADEDIKRVSGIYDASIG